MANTGDDWRSPPPAGPGDDVHSRSLGAAIAALAERVGALVEKLNENDTYRRWIIGLLAANLVALLAIAAAGIYAFNRLADVQGTLIDCTTAPAPGQHHRCFERTQAGTAAAVAKIVDTNGNGIPDTQELLTNQAAFAKARGIDLPYPVVVPPTTTTIPHR